MKTGGFKIFLAAIVWILLSAGAGSALAVTISTDIPGVSTATSPGGFVDSFYKFSLMISGVLALGAIVYGGVKYTLAAGNPAGQSEGKEWVKGALVGLLLLAGAYSILNIINPNITKLSLPTLTQVTVPTPAGVPGSPPPSGCSTGACSNCTNPDSCGANPGCTWTGFQCAGATQSCSPSSCQYCTASSTCNSTVGCQWTGSYCAISPSCGPAHCSACQDAGSCGNYPNDCLWMGFNGPCQSAH